MNVEKMSPRQMRRQLLRELRKSVEIAKHENQLTVIPRMLQLIEGIIIYLESHRKHK
jgi:hypothetical protein